MGVIVADILRLPDRFPEANASFVKQGGNGVAHSVAQKAVKDNE